MENTNMQMVEGMPVAPQTSNTEPAMATLADVIGDQMAAEKQVQNDDAIPMQEPGWYAKRRQKDRAEWEAENNAKMAPVLSQLAQLQEYRIGVEADKLVASGKITDRELAMEYLRNKEGVVAPAAPEQSEKPRDAQGRFTKAENVPTDAQQKANELFAQAQTLQKATGVDVLGLYNSDPDIKQKVLSGEWDFADVLRNAQTESGVKSAPTPVRNPNGVGLGGYNIRGMRSNDFAKLNAMLESGGRVDMRK